ncbi:flavin reductase family protein [Xanthobacter sediminis]
MTQSAAFDGDPAHDPQKFRTCLGQFATGVTVVTAMAHGAPVGMTVNSFASVSLDPPLILWSIGTTARSYPAFAAATSFTVNVLADDQIDLSRHFSRSGADKFAAVPWRAGVVGAPVLEGVAALFECERVAGHLEGDHLILIGRVRRAAHFERGPLLFARGRYHVAAAHPAEALA